MIDDPKQLIAVVGMAGRFPGAPDTERFWELLEHRGDAIRPVPPERWDAAEQLDPEFPVQAVGGFLDDVDQFDATFFGISPREAVALDPQQRLMLEASWQALEDAGVRAAALAGSRVGVYVGASWHDYEILRKERGAPPTQHSAFGNALDVVAARVSYFLKLSGPSMAVETGCSSSLVALHLATQALRQGDIEAALVGGVNLILAPDVSVGLTHFGGLSPTGRCQAFAASADGFVRGEGVAALYVKTLDRALQDKDRIHGVIVQTAVNNDGGGDSLVTPSPAGQENLLRGVYEGSDIPLDKIAYVEAHGTGTGRGDPIEAGAIGRVLGRARGRDSGPLPIGSVKTNIGHLEAAAGMAGLFKALLALEHRLVPPSLHAEELNPEIPFDELNVRVVREPLELAGTDPILIGVNSFGWGGTNAHVVVMSAPAEARPQPPALAAEPGAPTLLAFSAHGEEALRRRARDLREAVARQEAPLAALAGTLAWQRDHFPARAAVVGTADTAAGLLERFADDPGGDIPGVVAGRAKAVGGTAFVFPGQGSQWAAMGRDLFAADPVFNAAIRRCAKALEPHFEWDLAGIVSGAAGDEWLTRIDMLQPTLWAVSVALAEVWRAAGVVPDVVVGHSQGEVSAATVAGILSYEDAAAVIARRSAIARRTSGRGRMLAVDLDVEGATAALAGFEESVSLAVNNGPRSCVLSGDAEAVLTLKELLEADGTFCRLVNVDYASHSPQMDELEEDLLAALAGVRPREGHTPLMSTVRRTRLSGPEMDARYWVDNLRRPVLFADAMSDLFDQGITHVVEISPHPVLTPAAEELAALRADPPRALWTLRRRHGSPGDLALALARGYVAGLEPFGGLPAGSWAPVPDYPWQRRPYWVDPGRRGAHRGGLDVTLAPSVTEQDSWSATLEVDLAGLPWLRDHQVHDAVVLPGAGMMALAVGAARARTGAVPRTLADFEFRSDLTLTEEPARLAVEWRDDITEGGSFRLVSLASGATTWTEHARARVLQQSARPATAAPFPDHLLDEEPVGAEEFYAACAARGLNYGPAFQGVRRLYGDADQALGEIVLPERCRAGARPHGLHPALWDAALQVSLALTPGGRTVVPRSVHRVHLLQDLADTTTAVWSYAVRRDESSFDLFFFDADRGPLATLAGLVLEALPEQAGASDLESRLVRLAFAGEPLPAGAASGGSWAICADGDDTAAGGLAGGLARALAAAGAEAAQAVSAGAGATDVQVWSERLRAAGDPAGVVFFAPPEPAGLERQRSGLPALTALVRACLSQPTPPRLAVLTSGAQAVAAADVPDPGAALYWGYGRVLRREHPELQPLLLDISPDDADWAARCAAELLAGTDEDQVALRGGNRFVGRLVRGAPDSGEPAPWRTPEQPFRLVPVRPGLWDGLQYRPLSRRAPGPGEIEVEVSAAALNFIDVMKAMGTYPDPRGAELLGAECAGTVAAVGEGVTRFQKGDRVAACRFPSLASHVTVRADHAHHVPSTLADDEAAALPIALTTAWYGLNDLAGLSRGETVLIHSAAGGLGLAAVRIAKLLGAEVIATAGSEDKRRYLREAGIAHVFDSRDLAWADAVRAATGGRGVDVVLNSLTGAAISRGLDVLADYGRFVEVGKKDIYGGHTISLAAFKKGISLSSVDITALMNDRPERFARLFADVWRRVESGELTALPLTRYAFADAAEAMRAMSHGDHIGKFVVRTDLGAPPVTAPEPLPEGRLRADGTYLLTGGLGALGLSLAEFFAERGAGGLALLGRSAPNAAAAERIGALRARGVRVETYQADVADPAALRQALERIRAELPTLRGVVHAAGLLDDSTIANLRPEQLERVLAPKVDGARNLDAATEADPLDFFLLFSSAAALIGNTGQAAYAAGNTYLDALAERRRRRGLPGLSVQWGPFTGIGLAAQDDNRGARLAERGMGSFPPHEAWQALGQFLRSGPQVVAYLPLDLRQWFDSYPETAAQPSWSVLRQAAVDGSADGATAGSEFLARLRTADSGSRGELLESKVRELAGRVLRLDADAIERETSFKALGLDSLMSLEFRNRLESVFGLRLSPTLLWTYGNLRALSGALSERLFEAVGSNDRKD